MQHGCVAPTIDRYSMRMWVSSTAAPVAPIPEVAPPHAILPPPEGRYYGMQHGCSGPMIDSHFMEHRVRSSHRELFGTEATVEHNYPPLDHQGLPAPNEPYYFRQNQRTYITQDTSQIVHDRYSRYGAVEEIVRPILPSKGEYDLLQTNVVGRDSSYCYPTAALHQVPIPMNPNGPVSGRLACLLPGFNGRIRIVKVVGHLILCLVCFLGMGLIVPWIMKPPNWLDSPTQGGVGIVNPIPRD